MEFTYTAYTVGDGVVKGRLEAPNEAEAQAIIRARGYKPLRIKPTRRLPALEDIFPSIFGVGMGELIRFSRQMSTMMASGASLINSIEMIQSETGNRVMRRVLNEIHHALDEGDSFSESLAKHSKVFSPLYVSVMEVGEYTGSLSRSLDQMADILEKDHTAKQKAMQALMYPVVIMGLSVVTLFVLMTVALPPLLEVFDELDAETPAMTRIAIGMTNGITDHWLKMGFGLVSLVVGLVLLRRIPEVRYWMDSARIRTPIIGSFTVALELARFARTTAMLLEAGVPLATALQMGRNGCGNLVIKKAIVAGEESLLSGHGVSEAFKQHKVFPPMFVQLLTIGEESNSLQRTMSDAADAYQKQFDQRLTSLLGLLEPASTVVVGGIVGFIAISMFLPIYSGLSAIE